MKTIAIADDLDQIHSLQQVQSGADRAFVHATQQPFQVEQTGPGHTVIINMAKAPKFGIQGGVLERKTAAFDFGSLLR